MQCCIKFIIQLILYSQFSNKQVEVSAYASLKHDIIRQVFVSVRLLEVSIAESETVQWLVPVIILICDNIFAGSNSVNVFLGLGLPWVISTCYHAVKKTKYIVYSGNLTFSVVVFTTFGLICIFTLIVRRLVSNMLIIN